MNISAIHDRFCSLIKTIPLISNPPPLPPKKTSIDVQNDWNLLKSKKILRIAILDGHVSLSRPWCEMLAVKIVSSAEGEVGCTKFVNGSNNPIWNTELFAVFDHQNPDLSIGIVHLIDNQKYQIRNFEILPTKDLLVGIPQKVEIKVVEKGYINLLLEVMPDLVQEITGVVEWICHESESKIAKLFSEQVNDDNDRCLLISRNEFNQYL